MAQPPLDTPNLPPGSGGAGPDPSMEDILAAIRRILSDDEAGATPPEEAGEHAPAEPAHDVLLLNEDMMVAEPAPQPPEPAPLPFAPVAPEPPTPAAAIPLPALGPASPLVAPEAAQAAASAMGALVRTVAQERSLPVQRGGGITVEDIVREEIRPLLKSWLDNNLPPLVERLVRAEIEKVVGQASR